MFDLRSFAGRSIQSARLQLTVANYSRQTQTLYAVSDSSWTEQTLSASHKPSLGAVIGQMKGGQVGNTIEVDITQAVKNKTGSLFSLAIGEKDKDALYVYSKESSQHKPTLVIN